MKFMISYYFSAILLAAITSCLAVEEQVLLNFYNGLGMQALFPAKSCMEIYTYNFASHGKSGYYWIKDSISQPIKVYCDMQLSCGGKEGGWMKIAGIANGGDCPTEEWSQITSPVNACRANSNGPGCYSANFTNNGIPYQHVCGKIVGYGYRTPDGFHVNQASPKTIDENYVDGVSLTYGTPRKHLWTYANGGINGPIHQAYNCPCARYPGQGSPSFVQDHYYCDTTSTTTNFAWDGEGCTADDSCCSQAGMPWFYRQIPVNVDESIEVRICRDQDSFDEGTFIIDMELYVQ